MTLTRRELQRYEKSLRMRLQELQKGVSRTVEEALNSVPDSGEDVTDQAVSSYQKEMLFTEGATHHHLLAQVRRALDHIADGSYGTCQSCGGPIGEKRLEAVPWAVYCIGCQERMERGEIQETVDAE